MRDSNQNIQSTPVASAGVYIPPHLNSNNQSAYLRNGVSSESRYNKDQLIDIYKGQRDAGTLDRNLAELFLGGWSLFDQKSGTLATWGRRDETRDSSAGPEVCWNYDADGEPLALLDMTDEEKEVEP